jgi:creatinine amidohydrolase/Fe(II)-dependent formamide hydrolase-like protein
MLRNHNKITSLQLKKLTENSNNIVLYILPIGNEEVHGPCLPLSTDTILAKAFTEICYQAAQKIKNITPLILPTINYGYSPTTEKFSGTISIKPRILADIINEIISSLKKNHFKWKMIIINIHKQNELAINLSTNEYFEKSNKQILYINPYKSFANILDKKCFGNRIDNSTKETALLLAALKMLNKDDMLQFIQNESKNFKDKKFTRSKHLSKIRKITDIPFHYKIEEQHISPRTNPPIHCAEKYFALSKNCFKKLIEHYINLTNNDSN